EPVALRPSAQPPRPGRQFRGSVDREWIPGPPAAFEVEVEASVGRPLGMLCDDLVPGAVAPVVGRVGDSVLLGGVGNEDERPLGGRLGATDRPCDRKRHRDRARIVEGGAEPAVVVTADDARAPVEATGYEADDVCVPGAWD